jgi:hypothetical protein
VTAIRTFRRADLPAVAALVEARLPNWEYGEPFLAATLIDNPWADPELPSYVAVDERDEVIGFVGSQARRLRLGERRLRGVCSSHLVVVGDRRAGLAGALLLRKILAGPQDLTWTDSANDTVLQLWESLGGEMDYSRCFNWMLVLKPFRWLGAIARAGARPQTRGRLHAIADRLVPVGGLPVQAAGRRLLPPAFPPLAAEVESEDATAASIVADLAAVVGRADLRVDHDQAYLDHLFTLVHGSAGPLVRRIVRRRGAPVGWYAYLRRSGGVSRVLHVSAPPPEADAVVGELVEHARANGTTALTGRFEPHLYEPLRRRLAVLGCAGRPLIHARDPEVRSLLAARSSLLTHLDGEWFTA